MEQAHESINMDNSLINGTHSSRRDVTDAHESLLTRVFTEGRCVYDMFSWKACDTILKDQSGNTIFQQNKVSVPESWSETAALIVASKYLHGSVNTPERETGVRSLISRVTDTISEWGTRFGYFVTEEEVHIFKDELAYILVDQRAAFNSPVWFNVGIHAEPQTSACFIASVKDDLNDLTRLQSLETRLFKFGSGIGTNFSALRSSKEFLRGGGIASGPVSFMRALDSWAGIVKSGGKTRRAAKMMMLNVDHPDILEFVSCKLQEERKAHALIEAGYDGGFGVKGGAYDSVGFQNANISVRVSDEFMRAVEQGTSYETKWVVNGESAERLDARSIFRAISEATWFCGDPGLQYDTTINSWHTCPQSGRINGSNPCSEYMSIDNSACNLASINLLKYLRDDNSFDTVSFRHTIRVLITAQDILINPSGYPDGTIAETARQYRQLGLGYTNLGALLMSLGVPYDSCEGRAYASMITAIMTGEAYRASACLAAVKSPFEGHDRNRSDMLSVIRKHYDAAQCLPDITGLTALRDEAIEIWESVLELGETNGFRNSQVSVLAPTGTISFMMDCDTTGIEPDIALIKYKKLSGGGMIKIVNSSVARGLKGLGYPESSVRKIIGHIEEFGCISGAPGFLEKHSAVFDCALAAQPGGRIVEYKGHLDMMAAVQPFLSGAISKTVNLPTSVTVDEIMQIYMEAWQKGIKAVALYRDGSKRTQPLTTAKDKDPLPAAAPMPIAIRRRLPEERRSLTHRFRVGTLEGYITVGLFEDGAPGEIFLVVAKEGSTLSGVMDGFATAISMALQYGVPLKSLAKKFTHTRFEPAGMTSCKDVPLATSIIDYVFRWLALRFLSTEERREIGVQSPNEKLSEAGITPPPHISHMNSWQPTYEDAPPCTSCGSSLMIRQGSCYACLNCGVQGGCS